MGQSIASANFALESRLRAASRGEPGAYFDLGIAFSSGGGGVDVDLVQAHKWFNLASLSGSARGHECRAEIAHEMSAREIAEAQRQARAWLGEANRRAA